MKHFHEDKKLWKLKLKIMVIAKAIVIMENHKTKLRNIKVDYRERNKRNS